MELIDTHCHLDALEHDSLEIILERAARCSVLRYVCIGASQGIESAKRAVALAESVPAIWCSVGIHPHDAESRDQLEALEAYVTNAKVVAVGETGLDYFRDWSPFEDQRALFRDTIAFAKNARKPLIIHCRDAGEETLQTLIECDAQSVGGVFHCYAQDAEFAKRLRDINFLVSFTGNLTFKKATELRETASKIPIEQILLETDCPYMAPEPFRGKPSEPMHVYQIALKLAELKTLSLEEVAHTTTENAERFFSLPRR